jgi:hypothetical protein
MISEIVAINPEVKILVAQVIPAGKLPKYAYIPELNEALKKVATSSKERNWNVILVDQASGFDWKVDAAADKVHPNKRGSEKMAQVWATALDPFLKP